MSEIWVDTDLGFDDLWALLLLRRLGARIAGISLVAGNAPLPRVIANALGAAQSYGLDAPLFVGADRPMKRAPETAERVLGPRGMQSRGRHLPGVQGQAPRADAVAGLAQWLETTTPGEARVVLAIGPLTNIAHLVQRCRDAAARITRLVWMGGSNGPGNHTPAAEFNALADPDAAAIVADASLPLDVVDLTLCRKVTFGPDDLRDTDPLTADLLGGYLDIGLSRGRAGMAIYDPVAALAVLRADLFTWKHCAMQVSARRGDTYGATGFDFAANGRTRLATVCAPRVRDICLDALAGERADVG